MSIRLESAPQPLLETKLATKPLLSADHPTAVVYLDESGSIKTGRFFGIGCLKVTDGPALTRAFCRCRQVLEWPGELHWARFDKAGSLGDQSFEMAVAAMDTFFELPGASFCCMLFDRQTGDPTRGYATAWEAYEGLSVEALKAAIGEGELVSVFADHTDTPSDVLFEEAVKDGVNRANEGLTVATVTRLHSHAVDGLQLVDLLLGAAMFDFRQGAERGRLPESSQKGRLCAHLLEHCGIASFRPHGKVLGGGKVKVELKRHRRVRRGRRGGDPS
jgi:Protein of unknown function (DUF3800)